MYSRSDVTGCASRDSVCMRDPRSAGIQQWLVRTHAQSAMSPWRSSLFGGNGATVSLVNSECQKGGVEVLINPPGLKSLGSGLLLIASYALQVLFLSANRYTTSSSLGPVVIVPFP